MNLSVGFDAPRVLDFDLEARPLGWYGGDFTHKEVTAIAYAWASHPAWDEPYVEVLLLGEMKTAAMLKKFRRVYDEATMVTGHYIRGFDLPLLNAAFVEEGLEPLSPKLSQDTKLDLLKMHGLSKSQENLGALFGLDSPKVGMTVQDWRKANRLTKEGRDLVRARAAGDVIQHIELRSVLLDRGLLGPPKVWTPEAGNTSRYTA